jgi:hypothetical protein
MKITKNFFIYSILLLFLGFIQVTMLFSAQTVQASSLWDNMEGKDQIGTAFGTTGTGDPADIRVIAANVVKIFLSFMGIVFLVLNIVAGFKWMTAGGNEQAVTEAKSQLGNAFIGLMVILLAYSITYFVAEKLVQGTTGAIW